VSIKVSIKDDLKRLRPFLTATSKNIERAHRSALKSTAFVVKTALAQFVAKGGEGWRPLSFLTMRILRQSGEKKRVSPSRPYYWMSKMARYDLQNDMAVVRFGGGYSRGMKKGTSIERTPKKDPDNFLAAVVSRMEHGERYEVTDKQRRRVGAAANPRPGMRKKGAKTIGLKKETHTIEIKKRPVFGPVFRKVSPKIGPHYREKFFAALERYQGGGEKVSDGVYTTAREWLRG
jgi:hypothetical protein